MTDAINAAALGMATELQRLAAVSQNIANVSTVAYRRQVPVGLNFLDYLGNIRELPSPVTVTATDFRQGALSTTNRSLDVALEGDGFLKVLTNSGVLFTRRGDLRLDGNGRLVSSTGSPIAVNGSELRLSSDQVAINAIGDVKVGGVTVGRLDVTEFQDTGKLIDQGGGYFAAADDAVTIDPTKTRVRQGFLEAANVDPLREMTLLVDTSRSFELDRSALMAYQDMLDISINSLGQF